MYVLLMDLQVELLHQLQGGQDLGLILTYTVKNGSLLQHNTMLLLGHVSKIVSILPSKLSDCPNTDTLLCYYNYPFLTVYTLLKNLSC